MRQDHITHQSCSITFDAGELPVRFDERDVETEPWRGYSGTARRNGRQQTTRTYRRRATARLYPGSDAHECTRPGHSARQRAGPLPRVTTGTGTSGSSGCPGGGWRRIGGCVCEARPPKKGWPWMRATLQLVPADILLSLLVRPSGNGLLRYCQYNSTVFVCTSPPTTTTMPFGVSVAVWSDRAVNSWLVSDHVPVPAS